MNSKVSPMRTFDPDKLGNAEADAWIAYYRREWRTFLSAAINMVRYGFALSRARSIQGAWYVLRANQLWAPFPENDATGARDYMLRFYKLVTRIHHETFDVEEAATLEIGWWRAHREVQHVDTYPDATPEALVEALTALYAHVYEVPAEDVRAGAAGRAEAMRISDEWVAAGCDPAAPALADERKALVDGYRSLRNAVGPPTA